MVEKGWKKSQYARLEYGQVKMEAQKKIPSAKREAAGNGKPQREYKKNLSFNYANGLLEGVKEAEKMERSRGDLENH